MSVMNFIRVYEYDIPTLLSIHNFIKKNNIQGKDITTVDSTT